MYGETHNTGVKKAFLMEQVSSIFQITKGQKYNDPRFSTISIVIWTTQIEHALLYLGASVNLLPYSMYKQLGLGELKPTNITLQLADKVPEYREEWLRMS